ncbi:MAG: FeoB small GTPase domain-containing protein, partial [Syntrophomonadaceae bacterium]
MFKIVAVGNPNTGKSAVLNRLTGSRMLVSNYPGTSLEAAKVTASFGRHQAEIFDTPGIYSLFAPGLESEQILKLIEAEKPDLLVNVVDAGNLARNLVLTYELLTLEIPMLVLLNQIDSLREQGFSLDAGKLSVLLGCPVVSFSAVTGEGVLEAEQEIESFIHGRHKSSSGVGQEILLPIEFVLPENCSGKCFKCQQHREECLDRADLSRAERARRTAQTVCSRIGKRRRGHLQGLQRLVDRSLVGTVLLLGLAYLAFWALLQFISFSEGPISALLDPVAQTLQGFIQGVLPSGKIASILAQAVPEGLIIPFTIIMPAMLYVSILMALLEDSGLLP